MSKQETGLPLFRLLNKQFKTRIRGKELPGLFGATNSEGLDILWKKGILSVAGSPDRIPCPLGEHDDNDMVLADKRGDVFYWG